MKKTMISAITAFSLSCSGYALAGGPDTLSTSGLDSHWYMGVLGGAAINIANSQATYQNNTNNTLQSFDTTADDTSGVAGIKLGYLFNIPHNNKVGLSANINYDIDANIKEIWHIEAAIAASDPMDLNSNISPSWQYNFLLDFIHDFGNDLSIGIDAGFSLIQAKTTLTVADVGAATAGSQAAIGNHASTSYLPGGVFGLQSSLLITANSSLDFSINEYIYSCKNLTNIASIDTGVSDSLSGRKYWLSMPILALGYTYHF